ncbi:superoxide dismutase [Fe] domain protein (plasmid) [Blastomonas sp. RAC04]|jgi:Fe-Mn family superoxide dismutase|uniref:superoxide dismutase n=1 Tax=Blastomonas sp. RAC04 TaxID=1842535 RepID=UPI00083E2C00|nr:Fe-Mn family superoxide dismutase [Blastomonas sp. RAC04]AOG02679.1 superoxide dismutase [Fe] domain protein [Blastomonas sp. RAC04]
MSIITRRQVIGTAALTATGVALAGNASGAAAQGAGSTAAAFAGKHTPKPLRFNPAKLTGLSERLITSHWENNYQGSVRGLNTIEARLAAAMADPDFPPVAYAGLKREELHRTGSVVLHEYYFDALGGNGNPGGSIYEALDGWFGSFDAWQAEFRRTAMSLAGGSGWCILSYNRHTKSLHNYWAFDHMHGAATGAPLIALDMYEHSFHMDYGAAAAKYVDAFIANLDWEVVDARYRAAQA